jgi:CheY-like chemotaxis protein
VSDTGIGIPMEQHCEVFRPFYRLAINKTTVEGTGIGLAISKELVEAMDGRIGFESIEGKGSTFWFELPSSNKNSIAKMTERAKRETKAFVSLVHFPPNTKILYIEDNPQNQNLMKNLIERLEGLVLITTENAEDGIELCRTERPSVVLMDIHLPGISGIEATRILKDDPKTNEIPIIAVSANAMESDIAAAMDAGICEYITKPFNVDDIALAIRRALT